MFIHNFKYTLKILFKSKMLIFWTFAFPIILGALFSFAFSSIEANEKLAIIPIAIVNDQAFEQEEVIQNVFNKLGDSSSSEQIFQIEYTNLEKAKELLANDEISGYLTVENKLPKLTIKQNGINQTVFKYVVDEVLQTQIMIPELVKQDIQEQMQNGIVNIDYQKIYENAIEMLNTKEANIQDTSSSNLSYTMIEYYTLIAMSCLYGAMISMYAINNTLANMSDKGKRVAVSPIHKFQLIMSSALASYIVQVIGLALLYLFTIFVIRVDFGAKLLPVVLLSLVGCGAGLTLGIAVASIFRKSENTKIGIILAFTMLGCFLSGMMGITMKYIVDSHIPILNKINPANMVTDGFYSLYYYATMDRFWLNVMSLCIFTGLMILLSFVVLRRQKYDSI